MTGKDRENALWTLDQSESDNLDSILSDWTFFKSD